MPVYGLKKVAFSPDEKLGFFGYQVINKTAKNKAAKTATSRVNTDF